MLLLVELVVTALVHEGVQFIQAHGEDLWVEGFHHEVVALGQAQREHLNIPLLVQVFQLLVAEGVLSAVELKKLIVRTEGVKMLNDFD